MMSEQESAFTRMTELVDQWKLQDRRAIFLVATA
jgi:hypothetical protein